MHPPTWPRGLPHDALDAAVAAIKQSLKDSAGDYDAAAKAIDEAFGAADAHVS